MINLAENRKAFPATTFILALLLSATAGTLFVDLGKANPYSYEGEVPVKPDTFPPILSIISPRNESTYNEHVLVLKFNVSEPTGPTVAYPYATEIYYKADWQQSNVSVYEYISNPNHPPEYGAYSGSLNITGIPEGNHSIIVVAVYRGMYIPSNDLGAPLSYNGFQVSASSIVSFTIDTISPSVSVLSLENKKYYTPDTPLNFTVNESVTQITYSLDGQENVTIGGNMTLSGLSDGAHNVTVYAKDSAGNTGASETVTFNIIEPEPFPTALVIVPTTSVAVIGVGLLVYFKKRNH